MLILLAPYCRTYTELGMAILENVDGKDTAPKHKLKLGIHPAPQYSTPFSQYQYREPHTPEDDPTRAVTYPIEELCSLARVT